MWTAGLLALLTCNACHTDEARTQPATAMAHALEPAETNPVLTGRPALEQQAGAFHYSVKQEGGRATYRVTDGGHTISVPIRWAFGHDSQTWVLEHDGKFFESLVSYFPAIQGLDRTIGDESITPSTVEEAMGRRLATSEVTPCFGCHSTGSVVDHQLRLDKLVKGVTCARCHENANEHQTAISAGRLTVVPPKLGHGTAEDTSTFCGQCHRTWQTVARNRWRGVMNVRFQPYRLANSKCYDGVDERMSCTACHNPHRELVREERSYDAKCLACHGSRSKVSAGFAAAHAGEPTVAMPICKVSKENCVSCHMPKVELPGGHRQFTDHFVRVVRANESYPD